MSRTQWDEARVRRETLAAIGAVAKAAGCNVTSIAITYATPPERAEASAKASYYRGLASRMADARAASGYRELAKQALEDAGIGDSHLAKAREYEQQAASATDPELRRGYAELARQERAGAR